MDALTPVYTADRFPALHRELVALLRGLAPEDWVRPTLAGAWQVRDVVAHLIDGDLRKLSVTRDGHIEPPDRAIGSYRDLVAFLNDVNARWVRAARRLSSRVLIALVELTGPAVAELVASLAPHEASAFPVDWAGERRSEHWFDIGREYTERWHHQMQIRRAVGAPDLTAREWLYPVLDLSVRALARAYEPVPAPDGAALVLEVTGEAGGVWSLRREDGAWRLWRGAAPVPTATVRLDADTAWQMFYNALPADVARERAAIEGDATLAAPLFSARAIMI